jgi:excisionase family DNA binding protein
MDEMRRIAYPELPDYSITEDGQVYSHIKKRFLKGSVNNAGYRYFFLRRSDGKLKWYFAHRLVYMTYVGPIQHEVNHKDKDKLNNHYRNLEDITHRENIRKARELEPWKTGKKKGWPMGEDTKKKIGEANRRPVYANDQDGVLYLYPSTQEAADVLGVSYTTIIRHLKNRKLREYDPGFRILRRA